MPFWCFSGRFRERLSMSQQEGHDFSRGQIVAGGAGMVPVEGDEERIVPMIGGSEGRLQIQERESFVSSDLSKSGRVLAPRERSLQRQRQGERHNERSEAHLV